MAQLLVNWTIHQPGIIVALCGARRPDQLRETAGAVGWELTAAQRDAIDEALRVRRAAATRNAV